MNRIIAHLDMDAFFASIEERNRPHLKGKPIAVGSDPKDGRGRGVVSTANYKAREYGIRSAMPISHAWKASETAKAQGKPEVIFLPPNFLAYIKSSQKVLSIIEKYSGAVEQASVDEFYFDVSSAKTFKKATDICQKIKEEILIEEKVTCSIGIGPNKLISKIAAGIQKPNGLYVVRQTDVQTFLDPLPVRDLPGVGPKTGELLKKKNILFIRDLRNLNIDELEDLLGKWGRELYEKAQGIDQRPILKDHEVKSIGEQNTFEYDTMAAGFLMSELEKYSKNIFSKFLEKDFAYFRTITLTVRFSDFTTVNSSKSFKPPMTKGDQKKLQLEALKLLLPFLDRRKNPKLKLIRLIGIRIENLHKV